VKRAETMNNKTVVNGFSFLWMVWLLFALPPVIAGENRTALQTFSQERPQDYWSGTPWQESVDRLGMSWRASSHGFDY